jgi:16S rRNA C967 or C1407 C5-methylase (RsmB/RsmF family)
MQQQTLSGLLETSLYQRQLLATAVQLLKPGGCLVFSTCTINPGAAVNILKFLLPFRGSVKLLAAVGCWQLVFQEESAVIKCNVSCCRLLGGMVWRR